MTFTNANLRPANAPGAYILTDSDGEEMLLFRSDLDHLRHLIDAVLGEGKPHVHNTDPSDPDAHVLFDSVCCGAQLYRCSVTSAGLPSKPIIHLGEAACVTCGAALAQF